MIIVIQTNNVIFVGIEIQEEKLGRVSGLSIGAFVLMAMSAREPNDILVWVRL